MACRLFWIGFLISLNCFGNFSVRLKIIITILLVGLAAFVGIFFLKHLATPSPSTPSTIASQEVASAAPPVFPITSNAPPLNQAATIAQVTNVIPVAAGTNELADEHEAYVQAHIDKLEDLEANDDAQSLQAILSELTNSDQKIREAAIEATTQFGSRDAIPVLNNLAARTGDPDEKKQLLDAADFLALPTLTEIRAQNPNVKIHGVAPPPASAQP
jgi:hypothetical protein